MKLEEVYTCDGSCLGSEYVNIGGVQQSTRDAIIQLVSLDEEVDALNQEAVEKLKELRK